MLSQRASEGIPQRRVVVDNENERCTHGGRPRLLRGTTNCSRIAACPERGRKVQSKGLAREDPSFARHRAHRTAQQ
jgi:hypothetical protein